MPECQSAGALLAQRWGVTAEPREISVPGRVNLVGEHIDYHNLAVLPMALGRRIQIAFHSRPDRRIRAVSNRFGGAREFEWTSALTPEAQGDWGNYLKAAARAVERKWGRGRGVDAAVVSDLPPAAGLSSSSALLCGFSLALLAANGIHAGFEDLMEVLPEGEHFVGTRGGGMDHAAVLASRPGCASWIHFAPLSLEPVPVPPDWAFLVANSLTLAEKSGAAREAYNYRRLAGMQALEHFGLRSYADAVARYSEDELRRMGEQLEGQQRGSFLHTAGEAYHVTRAVAALRAADRDAFAETLNLSHVSASRLLDISCPALDRLVDAARASGALAARLTGAGFGGCAVIFCLRDTLPQVREELADRYYSELPGFDRNDHLMIAEPSAGALFV